MIQSTEAVSARGAVGSENQQVRVGRLLRSYRTPNNIRNWQYLGFDLLTLTLLICISVILCERHVELGLSLFLVTPLVAVAIVLIGAVQHRLAGLGHEGSHHVLFRNPWLNELVADWCCMFPLFTTTDHYRSLHLGHHRWVNDHDRDPEFHNLGRARKLHTFPMHRWQFLTHFVSRILWPVSLLRYSWDNMLHGTIGITQKGHPDWPKVRPLFLAGLAHFVVTTFSLRWISVQTQSVAWVLLTAIAASLLGGVAIALTPERFFYRSGYPACYGPKLRSWMRLTFLVVLQGALAIGGLMSGGNWLWYFRMLWILPLLTGFPYFMLLRDAYQHANTDEGKYTNSRVMFPDAFSRWAIFMYGSDFHLTHHLHPGVPHFKLPRLHESLKKRNQQYAREVVETHGTFRRAKANFPCLIETIEAASD